MYRALLKSHVHEIDVSQGGLPGDGACAIAEELLESAGIADNETIHVWNVANGERFVSHAVRAERGGRAISVHGSSACRVAVGDLMNNTNSISQRVLGTDAGWGVFSGGGRGSLDRAILDDQSSPQRPNDLQHRQQQR